MTKKCKRNYAAEKKKEKKRGNETIRLIDGKEMKKKCRRNDAVEIKKKKRRKLNYKIN